VSEGAMLKLPPAGNASRGSRAGDWLAGFLTGQRLPLLLPGLAALVLILIPVTYDNAYWIEELSQIALLTMVVSGVNLSFGYAGEVQFGQVFMFAVGAYLPMILAVHGFTDVIVLMALGGITASLVGFVVALPAIRIGGWSLAMVSFFLMITIPDLVSIAGKYTGGLNGLVGIPDPTLFGHSLGTDGLYEVVIVVMVAWLACYRNLVTSRYGVIFRSLRESPVLTRSLGFSTFRLKTVTYSLSALPAGIAGCLYGFVSLILEPGSFGLTLAIGVVAASVLGGVESVYACAIGAAILQLGPQESLRFANYSTIGYGLFLLLAAVLLRKGLGGLCQDALRRLAARLPGRAEGPALAVATAAVPLAVPAAGQAEPDSADERPAAAFAGQRLTVEAVSKSYGGVQALADVSLSAEAGAITALIGSNGSGKTTLLNVICGYTTANAGRVRFGEHDLTQTPSYNIARAGVGRTFQTPIIPRGVRVLDVVASGRYGIERCGFVTSIFRLPRYYRIRRADRAIALALLASMGLAHLADETAVSLPLGTRRLVEVARALCANPRLLLLDEPASGLSDQEVGRLAELISDVARAGMTVLLIEHNFGFVTSVATTAHVLHLGELIASGPASVIGDDPRVIQSYLGEDAGKPAPAADVIRVPAPAPATVESAAAADGFLRVGSLESGYGDLKVLRGVSLAVSRGTIEVVLGRNGVGKTTLLATIAGVLPEWAGSVTLGGVDLKGKPAYRRAASGFAYVQEGKRIFRNRTVWQNLLIGTYSLRMNREQRLELCRSVLAGFPVLQAVASRRAGSLSGGQQQMLAIAQALASQPQVLLLDEPSAGLAPAIVSDIFRHVRMLADDGLTVLLVEQLAQKAISIADHVTVLNNGGVAASGRPEEFSDMAELQEAYFGEL
jgi:branched-chain amino acid transport system permease protein